ncbi:MAG: DUF721 domain-containing protein [Burkholderiales bacterium]|nr:DUF721 domain-containing protein [Burkholderiales bacterium]
MKRDPGQPLASTFVGRHEALAPLAERAGVLIRMRAAFRDCVPPGLLESAEVRNFRHGIVVVGAADNAAAAKVRQLTPRLVTHFREKGWQVSSIQVQVQPAQPR